MTYSGWVMWGWEAGRKEGRTREEWEMGKRRDRRFKYLLITSI